MDTVTLNKNIGMTEVMYLVHKCTKNAKELNLSSEELREQVKQAVLLPLKRKYPSGKSVHSQYLNAFAFGVYLSETKRILQDEVEFCYIVDGELYSTSKDTTHKSTNMLYALNRGEELSGNFYWKNTNKVYF